MKDNKRVWRIVACTLVLAAAVSAHAGTFTTSPWTNDADSGGVARGSVLYLDIGECCRYI